MKELSVTNGNARNLNQTGFLNNDALHKRQKLQERIQNRRFLIEKLNKILES